VEIAALINNRRYAQKFWQKFRRHDADYYQIETLTICDFLFHAAVKGNKITTRSKATISA